jgi:predicted dienelactone hydrolase
MMRIKLTTSLAVAAVLATALLAPMAKADSTQSNKNLWRNLAIGAGVVAGHGLITHNGTETLIGLAGAAYSANRYEQERHSQSVERQHERDEYYRHHEHYYVRGGVRHYY